LTIPKKEAIEILKKIKLRFGWDEIDSSKLRSMDVYSQKLPITTVFETEIAEKIAKRYKNLKFLLQDFDSGEKGPPQWEPVFVVTCTSLKELKRAPRKIAKAIQELKKELGIWNEKSLFLW
jgi:hypothetical protein